MLQTLRWQEIYEQGLVPAIFGRWSTKTVALAELREGESVLDVACGTGVVARLAAQYVGIHGRVVGLDANPDMVEVARSLPAPAGVSLDWQVGDALKLPFPDAMFDKVLCQGGLQFVSDRLTVLHEMSRVLKSGGRLVLMVGQETEHFPGFAILVDQLAGCVGQQATAHSCIPFSLEDEGELRSLLVSAGFRDIVIRPEVKMVRFPSPEKFVESLIDGSCLVNQVDQTTLAKWMTEVSLERQPLGKMGEISFPMGVRFAVAST